MLITRKEGRSAIERRARRVSTLLFDLGRTSARGLRSRCCSPPKCSVAVPRRPIRFICPRRRARYARNVCAEGRTRLAHRCTSTRGAVPRPRGSPLLGGGAPATQGRSGAQSFFVRGRLPRRRQPPAPRATQRCRGDRPRGRAGVRRTMHAGAGARANSDGEPAPARCPGAWQPGAPTYVDAIKLLQLALARVGGLERHARPPSARRSRAAGSSSDIRSPRRRRARVAPGRGRGLRRRRRPPPQGAHPQAHAIFGDRRGRCAPAGRPGPPARQRRPRAGGSQLRTGCRFGRRRSPRWARAAADGVRRATRRLEVDCCAARGLGTSCGATPAGTAGTLVRRRARQRRRPSPFVPGARDELARRYGAQKNSSEAVQRAAPSETERRRARESAGGTSLTRCQVPRRRVASRRRRRGWRSSRARTGPASDDRRLERAAPPAARRPARPLRARPRPACSRARARAAAARRWRDPLARAAEPASRRRSAVAARCRRQSERPCSGRSGRQRRMPPARPPALRRDAAPRRGPPSAARRCA